MHDEQAVVLDVDTARRTLKLLHHLVDTLDTLGLPSRLERDTIADVHDAIIAATGEQP